MTIYCFISKFDDPIIDAMPHDDHYGVGFSPLPIRGRGSLRGRGIIYCLLWILTKILKN